MTGVLNSLEREDAADIIKKYGGKVTSAISGVTSYLLKGEDAGPSKIQKAKDKKTKIIDEDVLFDLIRKNSPNITKRQNAKKNLIKDKRKRNNDKPVTIQKY
ncbi:replication factor C subunit 1 [Bonamia ostreae]|uniref:Replication factor C subunit 1 n=1 Tax=Bonamia ostreae TaxID=126728 RepID=A0ABV2AVM9_9EUKA